MHEGDGDDGELRSEKPIANVLAKVLYLFTQMYSIEHSLFSCMTLSQHFIIYVELHWCTCVYNFFKWKEIHQKWQQLFQNDNKCFHILGCALNHGVCLYAYGTVKVLEGVHGPKDGVPEKAEFLFLMLVVVIKFVGWVLRDIIDSHLPQSVGSLPP